MEVHRPLRAVLFCYDCIRLLAILGLIVWSVPSIESAEGLGFFPYLVYAAPNALFPLMSFFLWRRFSSYGAYAMLYIAGKSIVLAAAVGWGFFSLRGLPLNALLYAWKDLIPLLGSGFLILADFISIGGGFLLNRVWRNGQRGLRVTAQNEVLGG